MEAQELIFPGETSKDLLHFLNTALQNDFFFEAIHLGINGIVSNKNSLNTGHVLQSIENIAQNVRAMAYK